MDCSVDYIAVFLEEKWEVQLVLNSKAKLIIAQERKIGINTSNLDANSKQLSDFKL